MSIHFTANKNIIILVALLLSACSGKNPFFMEKKLDMPGERIAIIEKSKDFDIVNSHHAVIIPIQSKAAQFNGIYKDFSHLQNLEWDGNLDKKFTISFTGNSTLVNPSNIVVLEDKIFAISGDGILYCYTISGEFLWQNNMFSEFENKSYFSFMSEKFIGGGLKVDNGVLYIATGTAHLAAFNAESGEKIFLINLSSPSRSVPVIYEDLVVVQTVDNRIQAFSKHDGASIWAFSGVAAELNPLSINEPVIYNEKIIAKLSTDDVVALDIHTGMEFWETPMAKYGSIAKAQTNFANMQKLALSGGYVYAASEDGKLNKLDVETGDIIWTKDLMVNSALWIAGNLVYAVTSENSIIGADINNGDLVMNYPLQDQSKKDNENNVFYGSPVMINGAIAVLTDEGVMLSVSKDGVIARHNVASHVYSEPKVVNGKLIISASDGIIEIY